MTRMINFNLAVPLLAAAVMTACPTTSTRAEPVKVHHKTSHTSRRPRHLRTAKPDRHSRLRQSRRCTLFPGNQFVQMFRNLIPALADKYHLVAPDYPGFGHSSMPPHDKFAYTFDNLAKVIDEFTDKLGLAGVRPSTCRTTRQSATAWRPSTRTVITSPSSW